MEPEVTQDERTMATLAQVLQLVGSWIAPLIIFFVKRQSRFVSFHALQALLLQIVHMICMFCLIAVWVIGIFATVFQMQAQKNAPPPPFLFILIPMFWLGMMLMWIGQLVIAIIYGIKAGRGEWAEYPVLGRLARKILKMGPGGTELSAAS